MKVQTRNTILLVICALIWGLAFVAQSAGSTLAPFAFLASRSWLAVIVLWPVCHVFDAVHRRRGEPAGAPKGEARRTLIQGGAICGTLLFVASAAQQIGITLNPSTAKASFITAMYVVLVPVVGLLFGRKSPVQIWGCVVLSVAGLYLLCMKNGFGHVEASDGILLLCAFLFTFQIMGVDHFAPRVDGVRLSMLQFFVVAVESTIASLLTETVTLSDLTGAALPVIYCGVLSSGVAYTLQILGQRDLNPAIASLAMCLESVFGALGGWLLLSQSLSARELIGCVLIFAAVVGAQLPLGRLIRRPARTGHGG